MYLLVIKEKDGTGFDEGLPGETLEVSFGEDFDGAEDVFLEWSDWIDRGINMPLTLESRTTGEYVTARPVNLVSIALTFRKG